jgi:hypothetical protein
MTPTVKLCTVGPAAVKQDISRMAAEQSQHKSFSSTWQIPWKETEEQLQQELPNLCFCSWQTLWTPESIDIH